MFSRSDGRQTVDVYLARGTEARFAGGRGEKIFTDAEVAFGAEPNVVTTGETSRSGPGPAATRSSSTSRASRTCSTQRRPQFHRPSSGRQIPWTGKDSNTEANVWSIAIELPTGARSARAADQDLGPVQPARETAASITSTVPGTRR